MNNDNNDISNCSEVGTKEDFIECVNKEFEPNEKTHGVMAQLVAGADNSVADDLTPHELRTMAECFYYAKYIIKEEDPQKAFYWYSKAAQGGDTMAIQSTVSKNVLIPLNRYIKLSPITIAFLMQI